MTTTKMHLKAEASSTLDTLLITGAQSVPKNTQVLSIGKSTQAHREWLTQATDYRNKSDNSTKKRQETVKSNFSVSLEKHLIIYRQTKELGIATLSSAERENSFYVTYAYETTSIGSSLYPLKKKKGMNKLV